MTLGARGRVGLLFLVTAAGLLGGPGASARPGPSVVAPVAIPLPPPSAAELAVFQAPLREDPIDQKPLCQKTGRPDVDCRDPVHYWHTTEPDLHLVRPYLEGLGGGYVGVGSDQNYSLAVAAAAHWVWLLDYDPTIVAQHHMMRAFILAASDRRAFRQHFAPEAAVGALNRLEATYAGTVWVERTREAYRMLRRHLHERFGKELDTPAKDPDFGWLGSDARYAYVRLLYQQGRVRILAGDLLGQDTVAGLSEHAARMHVPIRVYYPSNVCEFWSTVPDGYRQNVRRLGFDARSVALQTIGPSTGFVRKGYWHYNVQGGTTLQARLADPAFNDALSLLRGGRGTASPLLTETAWPPGHHGP